MSDDVRSLSFLSSRQRGLPVEVVGYRELVDRMGVEHFDAVQRPEFGLLFVVMDGSGHHTVDFERVDLVSGGLVFVRPGQVQQWHVQHEVDAKVVLARAELCPPDAWFVDRPAHRELDAGSMATAIDLVAALEREQARFTADDVSVRLMADLFSALVGLFTRASPPEPSMVIPAAYIAYRASIERDLGRSRNARWFIAGLGYSERTVMRACQKVTGLSAKGVLDARIVLEAKRFLANTDVPVGDVGRRLGFAEASNFNKFFARHCRMLPSEFRRDVRARGYAAERAI